ncbi:MAG: GYD domain-containing protein [Chloroflexota bacterium]|jgi:uncharacterized protein with GYD domain
METYIALGKYTKQGVDTMKEFESRIANTKAAVEKAGGQFVGFWLTMGQYDFVFIATAPDGPTAATVALGCATFPSLLDGRCTM